MTPCVCASPKHTSTNYTTNLLRCRLTSRQPREFRHECPCRAGRVTSPTASLSFDVGHKHSCSLSLPSQARSSNSSLHCACSISLLLLHSRHSKCLFASLSCFLCDTDSHLLSTVTLETLKMPVSNRPRHQHDRTNTAHHTVLRPPDYDMCACSPHHPLCKLS